VGEKMQKDAEVVSAALAQNLGASRFISRSLLESRTEMLELLARRGAALQFALEAFRADHELVQAAVAQDGSALQFASEELRRDSDLRYLAAAAPKHRPSIFSRLKLGG
ncbi:unnamed protein product, partial [Symbiodinium necroappetens]